MTTRQRQQSAGGSAHVRAIGSGKDGAIEWSRRVVVLIALHTLVGLLAGCCLQGTCHVTCAENPDQPGCAYLLACEDAGGQVIGLGGSTVECSFPDLKTSVSDASADAEIADQRGHLE